MFFLSQDEQLHFRILTAIVVVCGLLFMFFATKTDSIKTIAIMGENQIEIQLESDNEIKVEKITQTGKTKLHLIFINSSSYEDLLNCPGIGPKIASQIIKEREISPFYDWKDFQNRIKRVSPREVEILRDNGVKLNSSESNNDL